MRIFFLFMIFILPIFADTPIDEMIQLATEKQQARARELSKKSQKCFCKVFFKTELYRNNFKIWFLSASDSH